MPTDYKYMRYERYGRSGSGRNRILAVLLVLILMAIFVYATYFFLTRKTDEMILVGHYDEAIDKLDHWKWLPPVNAYVYEKIGTAHLLREGAGSAQPFFDKAAQKYLFTPISIWPDVMKLLWSASRYDDGLAYAKHIEMEVDDEPALHFYKAGFLAGLNQLNEARKELGLAQDAQEFKKELSLLSSEINQRETTGKYTLVYDRENFPLVNIGLGGETEITYSPIQTLLQTPNGDFLEKLKQTPTRQVMLSIDHRIQNAAINALGKYAGAIVMLDVRTGDILAAASNLKGLRSEHPEPVSLALNYLYEPGSIIKIITLAGAIESGVDLNKIFPFECPGNMILADNKILYDWTIHGQVKDIHQATAVSCNVAFAKVGLAMKPADLISNLKQFGFDSQLGDTFVPLDLGRLIQGDGSELYISHLSIGLDYLKMTPLHSAMVVAAIANKGVAMTPRLLMNRRNLIGLPGPSPQPSEYRRLVKESTADFLTKSMLQVVQHPEGTGRRAAIDGYSFAMKTGTAGVGQLGFDAIIIGFAPVPNPKVAFAIVLEHAGKAELEGTRVVKLFLQSVRGYIN